MARTSRRRLASCAASMFALRTTPTIGVGTAGATGAGAGLGDGSGGGALGAGVGAVCGCVCEPLLCVVAGAHAATTRSATQANGQARHIGPMVAATALCRESDDEPWANWLDARNRRRLMLAATLLTSAGAGAAQVARIVGYQRPETLARAFSSAGLPKPSQIRAEVAALGVAWERDAVGQRDRAETASAT